MYVFWLQVKKLKHEKQKCQQRDRSRMKVCNELGDRNKQLSGMLRQHRKALKEQELAVKSLTKIVQSHNMEKSAKKVCLLGACACPCVYVCMCCV